VRKTENLKNAIAEGVVRRKGTEPPATVARRRRRREAIQSRLRDYHAKTQPVLDLSRRKELIVVVDGTKLPAQVQQDIRRQLGLQ
jgi:adenylate kinase family enzyme